jgi:hypothetical protein
LTNLHRTACPDLAILRLAVIGTGVILGCGIGSVCAELLGASPVLAAGLTFAGGGIGLTSAVELAQAN